MTFQSLGLCAPILAALKEQGYEAPSPIQEQAIPPALAGRDVLGCAQTGTGKTCAFAAPILQRLSTSRTSNHQIRALILTPTRELAIQIGESFAAYGANLSLCHTVIFGGVGQNPQVDALSRGVDILVATPGRLMDLYQQGFVRLEDIEIFVLDEADRILKWLPAKKQTMLFSATMPPEIAALVNSLLHDPARVAVDPVSSPVEAIQQSIYFVDKGNKTKLLALLIEQLGVKNALVFTRTKHGANKVARDLSKNGITASTETRVRLPDNRHYPILRADGSAALWPPTSPPAVLTSMNSPMYSTITFPRYRRPMSTVLAVPAAQAGRA